MTGNRLYLVFALIAALALLTGLVRLFQLRFQEGDVYPPYSTLRSDPLGSRAFYRALAETPGYAVSRNHRSWRWLAGPRERSLLLVGARPGLTARLDRRRSGDEGAGRLLLDWVESGGRGVIALRAPRAGERRESGEEQNGNDNTDKEDESEGSPEADGDRFFPGVLVLDPEEREPRDVFYPGGENAGGPLFVWRSGVHFAAHEDWEVLLRAGDYPVAVRRTHGDGEVLLIADAFPFSNEAMLRERSTEFLALAVGGRRDVVFDEWHLGVRDATGVVMLARRYPFEPVLFAAAGLAVLFVWRSSYSLLPRRVRGDSESAKVVSGKGSTESLRLLLERTGDSRRLLAEAVADWRQSSHFRNLPRWKRREMEAFIDSSGAFEGGANETYQQLRTLMEKKRP